MNAETTPTLAEEFELTQAGLGKRNLTMSKDMTHAEFFRQLQDVYPKMDGLTGGWLLKKATDSEGYTGSLIRSASTSGKNLLYVVPLQQELDLTPLPADASESQSMPKATCQTCKLSFPLQILALHIQGCMESQSEDDGASQSDVQLVSVTQTSQSGCTEISRQTSWKCMLAHVETEQNKILKSLKLECHSYLYYKCFTEMVAAIEHRFFEGQQHGKSPRYSLTDLDKDFYKTVGQILSVSLAQGGPAPGFFSDWSYSYRCSGKMDQKAVNKEDMGDTQFKLLIDRVESSTDDTILELADEILSCGYTGVVSNENKESIIRAITLHAVLRLQPMLEQLREGMQLYGLLSIMKQYPEICRPLFVPEGVTKVNAEFIMASIHPQRSEHGSTRHQVELEMMNFIQDFLYEIDMEQRHTDDQDSPHQITPARFLQWVTGQGHIPILPSEKREFAVRLRFNHDCNTDYGDIHKVCYPVVSACAQTITLPVKHMTTYETFRKVLTDAFHLGQEFSNV
ncbi:hypothetical protein DPEC_G00220740 [Dallia pectoralis]|uniref:Uncharacterized protein n=1 Tax=Dallia pectoralis TaxID=75939 RepID=A0ACC2G3W2_DALPE|nr:hypothetical protein DPEC_G00220740 [Dallia pectoralis]